MHAALSRSKAFLRGRFISSCRSPRWRHRRHRPQARAEHAAAPRAVGRYRQSAGRQCPHRREPGREVRADGYNLLLTTSGAFVIAPFIGGRPPYDSLKDFAPITVIARSPILIVAGPKAPIASIADLVAFAKRAPGKVTYASSGVGGPPHLAAEMLKQAAGFDMLMIPYSGTGDVNVALLRGDVDIAVGALAAVLPLLQQKDVKALAVTSAKRSFALPNVPSIGETVPGYDLSVWFAIAAAAGTPRPIVEKIRAAVHSALSEPGVIEALARDGAEIATSTPRN